MQRFKLENVSDLNLNELLVSFCFKNEFNPVTLSGFCELVYYKSYYYLIFLQLVHLNNISSAHNMHTYIMKIQLMKFNLIFINKFM